jgi:hypothetical protein
MGSARSNDNISPPNVRAGMLSGHVSHEQSPKWVPFFTCGVNLFLCFSNDHGECNRFKLPDGTLTPFKWFGGLRLILLFACLCLGLQLLCMLPIGMKNENDETRLRRSVRRNCILTSLSLFAVPLFAIPPWTFGEIFRCLMHSWSFFHFVALAVSLRFVVVAHYPTSNKRAVLIEEPVRPFEPIIMDRNKSETVEKKSLTPTSFSRPSASPANRKLPAKLSSTLRSRLTKSDEVTDGLLAVERIYPSISLSTSPATIVYTSAPAAAVAGGGVSFGGGISFTNAAIESAVPKGARKSREPPPAELWAPIIAMGGFDLPSVKSDANESPQADDFWKKHRLWGSQDKEFFDDVHQTTQKPFGDGDSIQQWIRRSCRSSAPAGKYLDDQLVVNRGLSAALRDALNEELQRVCPSNDEKFYWLLLRLVYSSSKLQHPEKSWWYSKDGESGDAVPNNFCSVLREIQRAGFDVFPKYSMFNDVIHYHFEGLKLAFEQKTLSESAFEDCVQWVRSRPLLGVWDAKTKFERLLKFLEDPCAILDTCPWAKTEKVQLGEPGDSSTYQNARVRSWHDFNIDYHHIHAHIVDVLPLSGFCR